MALTQRMQLEKKGHVPATAAPGNIAAVGGAMSKPLIRLLQ